MKIALIGYGKMGKTIEQIALSRGHEIVSRIDIDNQEDFESEAFKSADVAIEFTAPKVAVQNYKKAFAAGVSVVSGTTGWTEQMPEIQALCNEKGLAFFWASNFSLGVNPAVLVKRSTKSLAMTSISLSSNATTVFSVKTKAPSPSVNVTG